MSNEGRVSEPAGPPTKRALGLTLIAVGKAVKVTLLVVAGVAALTVARHDSPDALGHWASFVHVSPGNHHVHRLIAKIAGVSPRHLEEVGAGSFVYAAIFAVEGTGLWLQKTWAEYLTLVVTLSFVPLEGYELVEHVTALRVLTLLLNVAALVYLVVRLTAARARARRGTASR